VVADQHREIQERLEAYNERKPYRDKQAVLMYIKVKEAIDANANGHFDRAIALTSEVIAIDPKKTSARIARGFAYNQLKKYELGIADLTVAIEDKPKEAEAYFYRADAFYKTRNYARAIDDLQMLETLSSDRMVDASNGLAWIFAACPEDQFRDGDKAADYIDRALEERPNDPGFWDTCAAVLAENDEFENAIEWEQACLDSTEAPEAMRHDFEKRLSLYQQHLPYRDEPESASTEVADAATPVDSDK
jgi:tetratricopeptide (TPR) repeat protein